MQQLSSVLTVSACQFLREYKDLFEVLRFDCILLLLYYEVDPADKAPFPVGDERQMDLHGTQGREPER